MRPITLSFFDVDVRTKTTAPIQGLVQTQGFMQNVD